MSSSPDRTQHSTTSASATTGGGVTNIAPEDRAKLNEDITQQENAILEEVKSQQPLVGPKDSIDSLVAAYSGSDTAPELSKKASQLAQKFKHIRRVRGDGNCFYRALLFAHLENLLDDETNAQRFLQQTEAFLPRMLAAGFPEFTTQDFFDVFMEFVRKIVGPNKYCPDELLTIMNADPESNYHIVFMRLVTSTYLLENESEYAPFIDDQRTMREYCNTEIDPMYHDVDHLGIIALASAFGIPLRIEYLDRSQSELPHDFNCDNVQPSIQLLYRPGHYDILYTS